MQHKRLMYVILSLATAICMLFGLTACNETPTPDEGDNPGISTPGNNTDDDTAEGDNTDDDNTDSDEEEYTEGLAYTEIYGEDGTTVIGYAVGVGEATEESEIVIPSEHEELPVLSVGLDHDSFLEILEEVFLLRDQGYEEEYKEELERLQVKYTFSPCKNLTSIVIPDSVTAIGWSAFENCSSLTSITIPDSITKIGEPAFSGCSNLESIIVAEGNQVYHSKDNCLIKTASKTLILGCKNSVIPNDDSVTSIGINAFDGCRSLTSIVIPDSVVEIGVWAFADCESLESIEIPDSVTEIGYYTFYNCSSLTNIVIPNSVTEIGYGAFMGCIRLTSITIPNGVTEIREWTFASCSSLTSIVIPNSVTSIEDYAFAECESLTSITYNGTKEQWRKALQKNALQKNRYWDFGTGNYTVYCTNGEIAKEAD